MNSDLYEVQVHIQRSNENKWRRNMRRCIEDCELKELIRRGTFQFLAFLHWAETIVWICPSHSLYTENYFLPINRFTSRFAHDLVMGQDHNFIWKVKHPVVTEHNCKGCDCHGIRSAPACLWELLIMSDMKWHADYRGLLFEMYIN